MYVLVLREKHGNQYFRVKDTAERDLVAVHILRERAETGYHYPDPNELKKYRDREMSAVGDSAYSQLSDAEVDALPESIKKVAIKERKKIQSKKDRVAAYYDGEIEWLEELNRLLALPDEEAVKLPYSYGRGRSMSLAWKLFTDRADHEYEGYELEPLTILGDD